MLGRQKSIALPPKGADRSGADRSVLVCFGSGHNYRKGLRRVCWSLCSSVRVTQSGGKILIAVFNRTVKTHESIVTQSQWIIHLIDIWKVLLFSLFFIGFECREWNATKCCETRYWLPPKVLPIFVVFDTTFSIIRLNEFLFAFSSVFDSLRSSISHMSVTNRVSAMCRLMEEHYSGGE